MPKRKTKPRPDKMTREQREAIVAMLECEGFDYYLTEYTSAESFERDHGPLPAEVHDAWRAYAAAKDTMEAVLRKHGATEDALEREAEGS